MKLRKFRILPSGQDTTMKDLMADVMISLIDEDKLYSMHE